MPSTRRSPSATQQLAVQATGVREPLLVVLSGFRLGDCINLHRDVEFLGRGRDASIHLPDDSVSRRHAKIEWGIGGYRLTDLGSTNGCSINGGPVSAGELTHGDLLAIGDVQLRYFDGTSTEGSYHQIVHERATRDALTGLFNRRHILQRLQDACALTRRNRLPLTIILMDIDHFKPVNDLLGHAAGDRLLTVIADVITGVLRVDGYAGRLGGDEFLVVLPEVTVEDAERVAQRIAQGITEISDISHPTRDTHSATLTIAADDGSSAPALLHRADLALIAGKRTQRGATQIA